MQDINTKVKFIHQKMAELFDLDIDLAEDTRSFDVFSRVDINEQTKNQLERKRAAEGANAKSAESIHPGKKGGEA